MLAQVVDVCVAAQKPKQLVCDRAQRKAFGREQRKSLPQVDAQLVAEDAARADTGCGLAVAAVLEHGSEQIEIGLHFALVARSIAACMAAGISCSPERAGLVSGRFRESQGPGRARLAHEIPVSHRSESRCSLTLGGARFRSHRGAGPGQALRADPGPSRCCARAPRGPDHGHRGAQRLGQEHAAERAFAAQSPEAAASYVSGSTTPKNGPSCAPVSAWSRMQRWSTPI